MASPDDPAPVRSTSGHGPLLVRLAIASALAVGLALLVSPGPSRSIPKYELGQYTTRAVRAPVDFSVIDEAATRQRREEAVRQSPPVLTLDRSVARTVERTLTDAFQPMVAVCAGQDDARRTAEGRLDKLTRTQRATRERAADAAADRFLRDHLATAWPLFERAVGTPLSPEERMALVGQRFSPALTAALGALLADVYARPIVPDLIETRRLIEGDVTGDGPGRLVLRNLNGGGERIISGLASLQGRADAIRSLPQRADKVMTALVPELRAVLVRLVAAQLRPNVSLDAAATRARQSAVARAVIPVSLNFQRNQLIVGEGQQVTRQTVIALDALRQRARPAAYVQRAAGFAVLFWLLLVFVLGDRLLDGERQPGGLRRFAYMASAFAATVLLFRLWLFVVDSLATAAPVPRLGLVLLFPLAATTLLTALVLDRITAVMQVIGVAIAASVVSEIGAPLAGYVLLVGIVGIPRVRGCTDRRCVLRAGVVSGAVALAAGFGVLLFEPASQWTGASALTVCGMAFAGGVLSGPLVIAASPILDWLFGYASNMTLLEMVSYDHPLLERIMLDARGTFQHSLAISILSDAAAEAIGANALLARVGALYHDAGKIVHPEFFVENQAGTNPHDQLAPEDSARMIRSHVAAGVALARQYGLGERIAAFVREHHGTSRIEYFAAKAEAAGRRADAAEFCYPGPRPRTRETAIVMIADRVEAVSRTLPHGNESDYRALIKGRIEAVLREGQLDECPLTLRDLPRIEDAMVQVLLGTHHHRIRYPGQEPTGLTDAAVGRPGKAGP